MVAYPSTLDLNILIYESDRQLSFLLTQIKTLETQGGMERKWHKITTELEVNKGIAVSLFYFYFN